MAHECPHGGVKPKALGIINIFIASEPSKNRLTEKGHDLVLNVLAQTTIGELLSRHLTQTQSLIEFSKGEQSRIRRDRCSPELQFQSTVEIEPNRPSFAFTHRVFSTSGQ
jgi:hypothetical protein